MELWSRPWNRKKAKVVKKKWDLNEVCGLFNSTASMLAFYHSNMVTENGNIRGNRVTVYMLCTPFASFL